ncbi:MAG: hypothetical protein OEZ51_10155 [Nitrospinota bacterium]|nr:hypothetical protein [Nitrospinota bacterium]
MIDGRFSLEKFESLGKDTVAAKELAEALSLEIQKEIHKTILNEFIGIISRLNKLGHNLRLYEDFRLGNYSFRDDFTDENNNYKCRLRAALDFVVSTGFSHLKEYDEVLKEFGIDPDDQ